MPRNEGRSPVRKNEPATCQASWRILATPLSAIGQFREVLARREEIDAVIGLPSSIFYGTGIPTCILVLKKKREHAGNILFIDASRNFEKVKTCQ